LTSAALTASATDGDDLGDGWQCEVCDFRNPPGSSPTAAKCALCGVPRPKASSATTPTPPRAASAPPSSAHLSVSLPAAPGTRLKEIACPACTFLNRPGLGKCEICETELPRAPAILPTLSRPVSPKPEGTGDDGTMLRLSFRKGGDKTLYAALKRSLLGKAWQVGHIIAETCPLKRKHLVRELPHRATTNGLALVSRITSSFLVVLGN
jgi:ESCRT-II complex subunit VPS36